MNSLTRRAFCAGLAGVGFSLLSRGQTAEGERMKSLVSLVKTDNRALGIKAAIDLIGPPDLKGKQVALKPNFNSADPFPGGTHNDTLVALVREIKQAGAREVIVADRSGMGVTRRVMEEKGIPALAKREGFLPISLDDLPASEWRQVKLDGWHWRQGVLFPRLFDKAEAIIQTCCLKTHRFGGHFTLSLKNSVGMVAKYSPSDRYDYMEELHSSPFQREMIAEVNQLYHPQLVIMDGLEAFVQGGPEKGKAVNPGVILASKDRVALDAVGVAILRSYGTTAQVARGPIFEQRQIRRAVELKLGAARADDIQVVTQDGESEAFTQAIRKILAG